MRKLTTAVMVLVACPLLARAQDLAFRDAAGAGAGNNGTRQATSGLSVPPAGFRSASGVLPAPEAVAEPQDEDDPVSDAALNALIGMDKDTFIRTHPGGTCVGSGPDTETCVYRAGTYSAGTQSDCPLQFACTNAMYGFRDGRLISFQSGFQFQYEWEKALRLARGQYDVPATQSTPTGASMFFRTRKGILGFGHSFAAPGRPATWAIRYYLSGQGADSSARPR